MRRRLNAAETSVMLRPEFDGEATWQQQQLKRLPRQEPWKVP